MAKRITKTGVGVIIIRDNKYVLVGKRKGSHGEGRIAFPGGHIDPKDGTLKRCGEREVLEETGMFVNVYPPDHYREELFTTFDILSEDGKKVYVTAYLIADYLYGGTEVVRGDEKYIEPLEPDKCDWWKWVTLNELAQMIQDEVDESWIPIRKVLYYLKQMGIQS